MPVFATNAYMLMVSTVWWCMEVS